MASSNCTVSLLPVRGQLHEIRELASVLSEVELALEYRDRHEQDRNPSMTATVRMVVGRLFELVDRLEEKSRSHEKAARDPEHEFQGES